ncbi:VOC family protein [Lysobacter sp. CFH 32150]|uniref:VOC family protein n=1 Tax=Lysobacter sp. CFH 32150 TaxID=2927128 RepID=UPI001FA81499|nr:VOC family protein [Lysobacter sp. CFH 32150]MCI4569476.1 glyoxalase [Lysobacter sp. CFH 32150]
MDRPIFHLSFPVLDLPAAKAFYCDALGATVGRDNGDWVDILLLGHQLTLHNRPSEVLPPEQHGVRHFGAILPWQDWMALGAKLERQGCTFLRPPTIAGVGTEREQGKMLLCDPSNNIIEIKAYRNVAAVLGTQRDPAEA